MIIIDKLRTQVNAITWLHIKQPIKQPIELPKLPPCSSPKLPINTYPKLPTVKYDAQGDYEVTEEEREVDYG